MKVVDYYKDSVTGDEFVEVLINKNDAVMVKKCTNTGFMYVMDCSNGKEVYEFEWFDDDGYRNLTKGEYANAVATARRYLWEAN